ncbi:MAG TPA: serine/threonine-protein kinase [Mycobacteriales bacterium]|nr:serine/threonine-protein kinase [Mycobacteriales bacterium]
MTDHPTVAVPGGDAARLVGDRYRLDALCGRGGSAEVWSALDEALERRVAIKLVTTAAEDQSGRVAGEARLLARLNHPGLVPVYDAGTDESGRPYVVMELVVGETLADTVRRGPLPALRAAEVGRGLAEALAYVHAQGMIHRDVKPGNVLVGADGRVRLTDFGIARLTDAAKVTATGLTVGTASYLSPEQVTGAVVGPASDVYSLGLVLLEVLKGSREYDGGAMEAALARLSRPPVIPDNLPLGWPDLLAAMTDLDAQQRPSAEQAAVDLARMSEGGTATTVLAARAAGPDRTQVISRTQALPPRGPGRATPGPARPRAAGLPPRPSRPPRRSRHWVWAVVLVAAIAALVAGGLLLSGSTNEKPPDPVVVKPDLPPKLRQDLEKLKKEVEG